MARRVKHLRGGSHIEGDRMVKLFKKAHVYQNYTVLVCLDKQADVTFELSFLLNRKQPVLCMYGGHPVPKKCLNRVCRYESV